MIDARELRIGNIVYFNNYEQLDIDQIKTLTFIDFEQICYDKHANRFSPIQLTQEILEKWCYFIYNGNILKLNDFEIGYENDDFVYNQFSVRYKKLIILKVKYLHQLQNLIYALTGEELKVNYEKNI